MLISPKQEWLNTEDFLSTLKQRLEKKLPSFIKTSSSIMFSENKKILIQEEEYANYYTKKIGEQA